MLTICPTFDYEIFFGKNFYDINTILINPTKNLVDVFNKNNIKITFYVDVLYLIRCIESNLKQFYNPCEKQIKTLIAQGHDIQLHLHPHWINAIYNSESEQWEYDWNCMTFLDLDKSPQKKHTVSAILKKSIEYLENLIILIKPDYKVNSYRGGGWSLEPKNIIIKELLENNIIADTSQFCGGYHKSCIYSYDYRNVPKNKNWYFDENEYINFNKSKNKMIFEIPIGSLKYNIARRFYYKYTKKNVIINNNRKGEYISSLVKHKKTTNHFTKKLKNIFNPQPWLFSTDQLTFYEMKYHLHQYEKQSRKQSNVLCLIGHPKDINESKLKTIELLINYMIERNIELLPVNKILSRIKLID